MTLKYKNGELYIDFFDLLSGIPEQDKIDLIESLSCEDAIIKHVTDQILDGWTENCCSGGSCFTAGHSPTTGLDFARRQIAKRADEIAKKEIEKLEKALKEMTEKYWDLINENSCLRRDNY